MFNKVCINIVEVMPRNGYRSLTIPEGLYVSISEVVREALREYIKKNNS
jgi:hypothetical protein